MTNLTDTAPRTKKRKVAATTLEFFGLLPNTIYTITMNGEALGFATRAVGATNASEYGGTLRSNANGELVLEVLVETPNFTNLSKNPAVYDKKPITSLNRDEQRTRDSQVRIKEDLLDSRLVFEITNSNGTSTAQRVFEVNTIVPQHFFE